VSKKLTIEYVKSSFESEGYKLLATSYTNSATLLEYICPKGHKYKISWNKWQTGRRCPYCNPNGRVRRRTIESIRKAFADEGYVLLTSEYINCSEKLDYICPNGHKYSTSWDAWSSKNSRCAICSNNAKLTTDDVFELLASEGYVLLNKYKNAFSNLKVKCPKGHIRNITWANWSNGNRCSVCSGKVRHNVEHIKDEFSKVGYTLLSTEYRNGKQKLKYICDNGHTNYVTWNNFSQGNRCPTCYINNYFGSNTPNWRGGITFDPYCEAWKDKEYKQGIMDRDGNVCLNPVCWNRDKVLTIHHIDYNKKNCKPSNLITVCRSCNSRANKDREWHKSWYQAILNNRYKI